MASSGSGTIQESNLYGNTAEADAGGIFNGTSGTLVIDDSLVCDNLALLGADPYNLGRVAFNDSTVCVTGP